MTAAKVAESRADSYVCNHHHFGRSKMALASGHWIRKDVAGDIPDPRHGQALAVAGNIAIMFGGCSFYNTSDDQPTYFNDFYMLTITSTDLTWEKIPQDGHIPCPRQGHTLCVVKGKIYLFGGCASKNAEQCLPGVYTFDLGSLTWQKVTTTGIAPQTLKHRSAVVGENIYVHGGMLYGKTVDDLYMLNTVSLSWTPVKTTGSSPGSRSGHAFIPVGKIIYMFGGCSDEGEYCTDVFTLDTVILTWKKCEVRGEKPVGRSHHTFTAHCDKDIYLFGGISETKDGNKIPNNDIMKLSLARMKWKTPLYVGIPPASRYNHVAFILHSHLYIFGGINEDEEFNDLIGMKLINPSDRRPIMKEIFSELGIHGLNSRFTPTKIPKVKYELTEPSFLSGIESPRPSAPATQLQDFHSVRNQAMDMIITAFGLLDSEFQKLGIFQLYQNQVFLLWVDYKSGAKAELVQATMVLQREKEQYSKQFKNQQKELEEMLEKHKAQNEAWLKARAEENDKERKEIYKMREEILQEQDRLREEQQSIQKRNQQLLSLMQQFKGM
ncbi:dynein alpha chain, flagellar outer arm-like [Sphaerodactylus townsendi]|uniref:dynein alpha chain, flagellar outer arm-like n=1 Tax=Sphaerodactylus townsendi TaxID=933632 RepID=UPI0020269791|nr:dynein alpha chain, flagellar outer arm-like [Sphaerodactylus townsendi]